MIRGTEYGGKAQKIKISFMNVVHEAEIAPYEIFTLLIDGEGMKKVNVLEENELKP